MQREGIRRQFCDRDDVEQQPLKPKRGRAINQIREGRVSPRGSSQSDEGWLAWRAGLRTAWLARPAWLTFFPWQILSPRAATQLDAPFCLLRGGGILSAVLRLQSGRAVSAARAAFWVVFVAAPSPSTPSSSP